MNEIVVTEEVKKNIEKHRTFWMQVAQQHDWYVEPFYVQVWVREDGQIHDSVSHIGMTRDVILRAEED